jgi:hypothetical protein
MITVIVVKTINSTNTDKHSTSYCPQEIWLSRKVFICPDIDVCVSKINIPKVEFDIIEISLVTENIIN